MTRRLSAVPPVLNDVAPPSFMFIVRTGRLDEADAAVLSDGVLTLRATDSIAEQLRSIEQVLRLCTNQPNQLRPVNAPTAVTA